MKAATLLVIMALTACATVPPVAAGPTAGIGQIAHVDHLRVRPLEVIEDSRCPVDVECFWAGRLVVRSEVTGGGWRQIRDLELGQPQHIVGGSLTLVAAEPQPKAGVAIDPRAYRFTFDFKGEF